MSQTIDLYIDIKDKNKLRLNKENYSETYTNQINKIFNFFHSISVEDFAKIIFDIEELELPFEKKVITLKSSQLNHLDYLKKVYFALLTKIPRIEFKQMIMYMIHYYLNHQHTKKNPLIY